MLNLSTYIPSLEEFEEVPSPLMDGDVAPVVEGGIVGQLPTEGFPVEQSVVELPPALDPTPLQPLEAGIIQEEVIAENLDAEAGQLMGAQIALEGYSKLLRSAGKNMTRQSAAFMAVGMQRANRILGVTALGLESDDSGTQVMAMQTAKVDEKGLGDKIKEVAGKIWEWLKEKYAQLRALYEKLKARFSKNKERAVYLLAVSAAVESGSEGAVNKAKALEAPSGLKASQVLDAIHGEAARKPVSKTVSIPGALAKFVVSGGKLSLSPKVAEDGVSEFIKDATEFTGAVNSVVSTFNADTTEEEAKDTVNDLLKKHMAKGAKEYKVSETTTLKRTAEGTLVVEEGVVDGNVEIQLPSLQEINSYLKSFGTASDEPSPAMAAFLKQGDAFMENKAFKDLHIRSLGSGIVTVFRGSQVDQSITAVNNYLAKFHSAAIAVCDLLIAAHGGLDGTISQEDYEALPSRGLSVIPGQSGGARGVGAAVKAAWAKTKEFFARLWAQFSEWVAKLWARIFGEEKKVDMLLLMNEYVPEGGAAPSSTPPALPPGTGLRSVAAARSLPSPGQAPQEAVQEVEPEPSTPERSLPKGMVWTESLGKLKLGNGYAVEPSVEEAYIAWFTNSYKPALIKMWRDVISLVQSDFDVSAFDQWGSTLTNMAKRTMQGAPVGEYPGGMDIGLSERMICFSFGPSDKSEAQPIKALNKRQIAQVLARQKKASKGLELIQGVFGEVGKLADQFDQVTDRLIEQSEDATADQYAAFYTTVRKLMNNNAIGQMGTVFFSSFKARTELMDAMIAARAKGTV
jgi:hypothetical protein